MKISKFGLVALALAGTAALCGFDSSARASIILTTGAATTTGSNLPVNATATFDFLTPSTLQVTIANNLSAAAQGQSISMLTFDYTGFSITGLASATGNTINFQTSATASNANLLLSAGGNWNATAGSSTAETLSALTGAQPQELIIGPSGSPNGNLKNFEPYVDTTATFVFNITGKLDTANITDATFNFGTSGGEGTVTTTNTGGGRTPEPASLGVLSLGGMGLLLRRRK